MSARTQSQPQSQSQSQPQQTGTPQSVVRPSSLTNKVKGKKEGKQASSIFNEETALNNIVDDTINKQLNDGIIKLPLNGKKGLIIFKGTMIPIELYKEGIRAITLEKEKKTPGYIKKQFDNKTKLLIEFNKRKEYMKVKKNIAENLKRNSQETKRITAIHSQTIIELELRQTALFDATQEANKNALDYNNSLSTIINNQRQFVQGERNQQQQSRFHDENNQLQERLNSENNELQERLNNERMTQKQKHHNENIKHGKAAHKQILQQSREAMERHSADIKGLVENQNQNTQELGKHITQGFNDLSDGLSKGMAQNQANMNAQLDDITNKFAASQAGIADAIAVSVAAVGAANANPTTPPPHCSSGACSSGYGWLDPTNGYKNDRTGETNISIWQCAGGGGYGGMHYCASDGTTGNWSDVRFLYTKY